MLVRTCLLHIRSPSEVKAARWLVTFDFCAEARCLNGVGPMKLPRLSEARIFDHTSFRYEVLRWLLGWRTHVALVEHSWLLLQSKMLLAGGWIGWRSLGDATRRQPWSLLGPLQVNELSWGMPFVKQHPHMAHWLREARNGASVTSGLVDNHVVVVADNVFAL